MKQEVIDFEFEVIQRECGSAPLPRSDPHNLRYSPWELNELLQQVGELHQFRLKWVGNDHHSAILAFFYCYLQGALREDSEDNAFVGLKHSLYNISKEWLSLPEQKVLVEHLCLVQYSRSIGEFLKKSNHFEAILIKLFSAEVARLHNKSPVSKL